MVQDEKSILQILCNYRNGWIICLVSILINSLRCGINYTYGLYIAELRKIYGSPMVELNWTPVIITSISYILTPVPALFMRFNPKRGHMITSLIGILLQSGACLISSFVTQVSWLLLTFGVTFGIGSSLGIMASTLILNEFFPKSHEYHEFATSVFQCAFPAGLLIFTSIYAWLIETYSWRWALRVAAIKTLVLGTICSLLLLLKKPHFSNGNEDKIEKKRSCCDYLEVFRKPERVCWLIGVALIFASQLVVVNNLPHYMTERGFSTMESSLLITIVSISQLMCYVALPFLGKFLRGKLVYANIVGCLLYTLQFLIWPAANPSYGVILLFAFIIGIAGSLSFVYLYPGSGEVMAMDIGICWPATCIFAGLGALLAPFLSGAVYDYTHSYDAVFYVAASVCFVNTLFFAVIPTINYCRKINYEILS